MRLQDVAKHAGGQQVLTQQQCGKLHTVLLEMLDDILAVCHRHDLKFILIGGTAIGALRHGGFIPWDDDIDIAMPRQDLDRFTEAVRRELPEKYSMLHPQDRNNYGRVIPKFRLTGTEYRTVLERDLDECGIAIDIYPIENVYDNGLKMRFQGFMAMALGLCLACRRLYKGRSWAKELGGGLSFRVKSLLGFFLSFAPYETWARWADHWHSRCKDENTRRVSIPTDTRHFFGELFDRDFLCDTKPVSFEGRVCQVPKAVDPYLRAIYGDYMTVPPEQEQLRNRYLAYDLGRYDPEG